MYVFVPTPPLPARPRRQHTRMPILSNADSTPPSLSLDTLHTFRSFCERAQDSLCAQTAALDGLGTFDATPHAYPSRPRAPARRSMHGGRFFEAAHVAVWTSTTRTAGHPRAAAGLSLNLAPRDPTLPALRADAHYFQIGAAGCVAWWFAGTADLSAGRAVLPQEFEESLAPFLLAWEGLRKRHRCSVAHVRRAYLDACLKDGDLVGGFDRGKAFGFVTEVVDELLPAYLPLLTGGGAVLRGGTDRVWSGGFNGLQNDFGDEEIDRFCIDGGARCESTTVKSSPLGSWSFSLAPSGLTPAGKAYVTLRNDHRCGNVPYLYI